MVFITGDTHGDPGRLSKSALKDLSAGDTLIVCGDFGFIWDGSKKEKAVLKKLMSLEYTICFIDGCHENFDMLEKFSESTWNGGMARVIAPNLIHLMRGQIYTIEGKKIFTFGGGHSQDFKFRRDSDWWEREQPSHEEIMEAVRNLEANNHSVDYVITHENQLLYNKIQLLFYISQIFAT